ncbi:HEPN domain-containing protein [Roseomonas sp. CCTCC AB2023176]|uniref:HEPN domain-containing protein n=1 Tax=Roseomonas sp. CCTCC AB2023176 TaxID=3342640 RepID=UPI0035DEC59A
MANGIADAAGREAYLAGFHAAWAYIVRRTGEGPKTHAGTRTELARLIRELSELPAEFGTFLGRGYEFKIHADYFGGIAPNLDDARDALDLADRLIRAVEVLLTSDDQSA